MAVVSMGLWPGEPAIRLERLAVNVADYEIPDNDAAFLTDGQVEAGASTALPSRLPIRAIEQGLLDAGIPARVSNTAGTFLCADGHRLTATSTQREVEGTGRRVSAGLDAQDVILLEG